MKTFYVLLLVVVPGLALTSDRSPYVGEELRFLKKKFFQQIKSPDMTRSVATMVMRKNQAPNIRAITDTPG